MTALPAAGWFPDPTNPAAYRWWDGQQWTQHVQQALAQAPAMPHAPVGPAIAASLASLAAPVSAGMPSAHPGMAPSLPGAPMMARGQRSGSSGKGIFLKVASAIGAVLLALVVIAIKLGGATTVKSVVESGSGGGGVKLSQRFSTPDGGFTMMMPEKAKHSTQSKTTEGRTITTDVYTATSTSGKAAFVLGTMDFTEFVNQYPKSERSFVRSALTASPDDLLKGMETGAAEGAEGTVKSSAKLTVAGYPARDVVISRSKPGVAQARLVINTDTLQVYILVIVTKSGDKSLFNRAAKTMTIGGKPATNRFTAMA